MNNINIIGRLTQAPELQGSNTKFCKFCLAVPRSFGKETDFINCVIFNKSAETLVAYSGKGRQIGVSGRLQTEKYTTNDGKTLTSYEIVVDRFDFLDKKQTDADVEKEAKKDMQEKDSIDFNAVEDDDLPWN